MKSALRVLMLVFAAVLTLAGLGMAAFFTYVSGHNMLHPAEVMVKWWQPLIYIVLGLLPTLVIVGAYWRSQIIGSGKVWADFLDDFVPWLKGGPRGE